MTACPVCDREFQGRPNRLYCSRRCKKRAERLRERMQTLTARYIDLNTAADDARRAGDHEGEHFHRLRARRAYSALQALSDHSLFEDSPQWMAPLRAVLLSLQNRPPNRPGL